MFLAAACALIAGGYAARPGRGFLLTALYVSLLIVPAATFWLPSGRALPRATRLFLAGLAGGLAYAFLVQRTGGLDSPLWPGYFAILAVPAFAGKKIRVAGGLTAIILFLESSALLATTGLGPDPSQLIRLLCYGTALVATVAVIGWLSHRRWRQAAGIQLKYEQLRNNAQSLEELGVESEDNPAGPLSRESREGVWAGAAMKLDEKLAAVLKLAATSLGADACGLFLLDEAGEGLHLRMVRPEPSSPLPAVHIPLAGEIIGNVFRSDGPLIIGRFGPAGRRGSFFSPGGRALSLAAAPVTPLGAAIGVLVAEAARPDAFAEKKDLLTGFARQVEEVFLTSHRTVRTEAEGRKQDAMFQVSNALASNLKERDIIATLIEETAAVMGYRQGAFFSVNGDDLLTLRRSRGIEGAVADRTFNARKCLLGYLVAHKQPLLFDDLEDGKRRIPVVTGLPFPCRSLMAVPLVTDERLSGILLVADPEPGRFRQTHLDFLKVLANQAAVQLVNAALHERMEQMAITDGLTGLFNHRFFHERLGEELVRVKRHPEPLSVIILDIDHFKNVNDTYGHPFGDVVLKGVARLLTTLARETDLVARYGGEEMALLLVNTNRRGAATMANRVMKGMRQLRFPSRDTEVVVTASLGSATYPDDAATASELIRSSDEALYRSKREGRDRYTPAQSEGSKA